MAAPGELRGTWPHSIADVPSGGWCMQYGDNGEDNPIYVYRNGTICKYDMTDAWFKAVVPIVETWAAPTGLTAKQFEAEVKRHAEKAGAA